MAIFPLCVLVLGAGCSGINASGSVSPATFFLPGFVQARPAATPSQVPLAPLETNSLLAQSL